MAKGQPQNRSAMNDGEFEARVPPRGEDASEALDLGLQARDRGDYQDALRYFESAQSEMPGKVRPNLEIARTLRALGRHEDARLVCQNILQKKPDCNPALHILGLIAFDLEDFSSAVTHFKAAAKSKPLNANSQDKLASSLLKLGLLEEAEALCSRSLQQKPGHSGSDLVLARVAKQRGDIAGAVKHFDNVAARKPEKTEVNLRAVNLLRRAGQHAEAEQRCRQLLERQPDLADAAHVLGLILWKRGDIEGALERFRDAAELKPSDANFQLTYARMLRSANRLDEARSRFKTILENFPGNVSVHLGLAAIARSKSELPDALALFEEAARLSPDDPVIPLEMSFILSALHRHDEAQEKMQLSQAMAATGTSVFYAQRKFENFCQTEQWEKAEKCLEYWPSLREVPAEMVSSLARFFVECRKWDELLDFFRSRVVEHGWNAGSETAEHVIDFVAIATRQTGRYAEILEMLEEWHANGMNGLRAQLLDQLNEEVALLKAVGAFHPPDLAGKISDPLREERHALRLRVLNPDREQTRRAENAVVNFSPEQKSRDTIFFCTDTNYLLPAATSLFSLLRHNHRKLAQCRIVAWCSPEVLAFASDVLGSVAANFGRAVEILSSATLFSKGLRFRTKFGAFTGRLLSEAAYYRLFAATQLSWEDNPGRALYIDSDTCCAEGIDRLLSFDMQDRPLAARRESPDWPGTLYCSSKLGLERGAYFNSGVLLFDLAHPALQSGLEQSIDAAIQRQNILTNLDQCALNLGFRDQVTTLDARFNYAVRNEDQEAIPDPSPTIVHFTAFPKPWDPRYRNRHCMRWFSEFEGLAEVIEPMTFKRLAASFIPHARDAHGICAAS